jgi:hypothetical protein
LALQEVRMFDEGLRVSEINVHLRQPKQGVVSKE